MRTFGTDQVASILILNLKSAVSLFYRYSHLFLMFMDITEGPTDKYFDKFIRNDDPYTNQEHGKTKPG